MAQITPQQAGGVNVVAFLDMLAWSEGTDKSTQATKDRGYDVLVGGQLFNGYADHPRVLVDLPKLKIQSTAAGRYQLLRRYYDAYRKSLGLKDFSPLSQDLKAIVRGRLDEPAMSILNVLISRDQLVVAADTLAEDALTGAYSAGAKVLLIPQHNVLLATRGGAQFFLKIYELALQASFRADFSIEQLSAEMGPVMDQLWLNYEKAAAEADLPIEQLGTEIVLGGWSPRSGRMMATVYAKSDSRQATSVQPIGGQFASPGDPLKGVAPSMLQADLMTAGRLQANYLNEQMGRQVAGGRLLIGFLQQGQAVVKDLGPI